MTTTLVIGGTTIDPGAARIVIDRLTVSLDRSDELEFHEEVVALPGTYAPEQTVSLTDGGIPLFTGRIYSRHPDGIGTGVPRVGYRCLGLAYSASLIPVTAADGTGTMRFNLTLTDTLYVATEAGQSVGAIISQVLAQHSTPLAAAGITTDPTTASQLAALTVVSPDPVYIQGNSLWVALQQHLQEWYGSRYALNITPAGLVRCFDTTALTPSTITLNTDPAILTSLTEDTAECYTQVILRGWADTQPAYLSTHDGTLVAGWTAGQQSAWTINDFLHPKAGYDSGTITLLTSTQVTVQSDFATATWGANYWPPIQGQIYLINPVLTGLTMQESEPITANTALVATGTSVITLASPLANTGYTRYYIRGIPPGPSQVWRKYTIPNTYIAEHLTEQFNKAVPWGPSQLGVAMVNSPQAVVCYPVLGTPPQQFSANIEVIPYDGTTDGYILFYAPVVQIAMNSQQALQTGGSAITAPSDVQVLVPYSRGALHVTSPSGGGYSGTAFTRFGVQRTLYRDYPSWLDRNNSPAMQILADQVLSTVSNAVQEGSIAYLGKYTTALPTGSFPIAINVAGSCGMSATGLEALAAPVRTVTLEWPQDSGAMWITTLSFSTRRQMYSGDRLYLHPMYASGGGLLAGFSGFIQAGVGYSGVVNPAAATMAQGTAQAAGIGAGLGQAAGLAGSTLGQAAAMAGGTLGQAAGAAATAGAVPMNLPTPEAPEPTSPAAQYQARLLEGQDDTQAAAMSATRGLHIPESEDRGQVQGQGQGEEAPGG